MGDLISEPVAGGERAGGPRNGGAPPPILMAALAAAAVIAVVLFATLGRFGDGDEGQPASVGATPPIESAEPDRATLTVTLLGSGDGVVQIQPGDIACTRSCDHEFDKGTRVTVSADPGAGSTFVSWDDACEGDASCSIVLDADRAVDAKFEAEPASSLCDEGLTDEPGCGDEDLGAGGDDLDPDAEALDPGADELDAPPPADCADGRDNDRDGLTDLAQDPDCTSGRGEGGSSASPGSTARPGAAPRDDCSDGKDNDRDGLTDAAQDPDCTDGNREAG